MNTNEAKATGTFTTNEERLQYLADMTRRAAGTRPSSTVSAEVMALVYEVAAGRPGALEALRERV